MMLNDIDKKNPFKVPENYFEDFHASMMSQIMQESKAKIVPLWRKISTWASVAAAVVVIIIIINIPGTQNTSLQTAEAGQEISQGEDKVLASTSSDDEDFYLYLENQVDKQSYYSAINF